MIGVAMDVSAEPADGVDEQLVRQLAAWARAESPKLTGEGELFARLTKVVVESAWSKTLPNKIQFRHQLDRPNGSRSEADRALGHFSQGWR